MTTPKGRGVRVEISNVEGTPVTVSAITQANPGVATSTAHGQANKTIGYLSGVEGMVQLEGQAVRVAAQAANTFELEDIETSDYPAFSDSCTFTPITSWHTLGRVTGWSQPEGAADPQDDTVLLDVVKQEVQGLLNAQTLTFNLRTQTISDTAMKALRRAARRQQYLCFRITLHDGNIRFFRGAPALPSENLETGGTGTGSFSVTVKGVICEGAA